MSEADALLDAIFDQPEDDTPRLVYADWLQEHGQENYAEFIRLQCAVARCEPRSDEANNLWERINRVWDLIAEGWWAEERWWADTSARKRITAIDFWRGFSRTEASIDWSCAFNEGALIYLSPEMMARVWFILEPGDVAEEKYRQTFQVASNAIRELKVTGLPVEDAATRFLDWGTFLHLKQLDLRGNLRVRQEFTSRLTNARWSQNLRRIYVTGSEVVDLAKLRAYFGTRLIVED